MSARRDQSLRQLTQTRMMGTRCRTMCARVGVAVVLVPALRSTGISGCARWLTEKRALIGLTLRYKTDDQFWFTFFHELGHVLLHRSKRPFVVDNAEEDLSDRVVDPEMQQIEAEANRFSADTLIPPACSAAFLRAGVFTNDSIHEFSETVGVGPGIVVGRLQHEGVIAPIRATRSNKNLTGDLKRRSRQLWWERSSSRGQGMIRNSANTSRTRTWVRIRRSAPVAPTCGNNSKGRSHLRDFRQGACGSQYVMAGFEIAAKIDGLTAYQQLPEHRLHLLGDGQLDGEYHLRSRRAAA